MRLRQVLNELVMDRGMSPFLTSLDCYCDDNYITDVQARRSPSLCLHATLGLNE